VGIPDWALGAHQQVADIAEQLEADSAGLPELRRVYGIAAQMLEGQDWERFLEALANRTHGDDKGVHSVLDSLFARAESSWPAVLKKPTKQTKIACRALFLGDPPSKQLCEIFQFHRWKGVFAGRGDLPTNNGWCEVTNIGAMPENAGRPLTATWVAADLDEETSSSEFQFIYINSMFQSNATKTLKNESFLPLIGVGLPPIRKVHYGARLREFREHLYTAIQKLADGGTLCMAWSGPPCHPVLFFIAAQLRSSFKRVRLVTPTDSTSLEIYILAIQFQRTAKCGKDGEEKEGAYAVFQHFLGTSQRSSGCDDVLAWCPTRASLIDEWKKGKADYENVFHQFANKVKAVSEDIGSSAKRGRQQQERGGSREGLYQKLATASLRELEAQGTKLPKISTGDAWYPR